MSGLFSIAGVALAFYVKSQTKNNALFAGISYFVAMEILQYVQFFWIDDCDSQMNQFFTWVGYLHICFQPYFTHLLNSAMVRNPSKLAKADVIKKLSLLGGVVLMARYFTYNPAVDMDIKSLEWLSGDKLCTYKGNHHLAWSIPLRTPTYFVPSTYLHFWLMFAPFFVLGDIVPGAILMLTGPILAAFITPNLQEQASIWCFFSIGQITILCAALRARLGADRWAGKDIKPKRK